MCIDTQIVGYLKYMMSICQFIRYVFNAQLWLKIHNICDFGHFLIRKINETYSKSFKI